MRKSNKTGILMISAVLFVVANIRLHAAVEKVVSPNRKFVAYAENSQGNIKIRICRKNTQLFYQETTASIVRDWKLFWKNSTTLLLDSSDIGRIKFELFKGIWIEMRANQYVSPSGKDSVQIHENSRKRHTVSLIFGKPSVGDFPMSYSEYFYLVTKLKVADTESCLKWLSSTLIELSAEDGRHYFQKQTDGSWWEVSKMENGDWKTISEKPMTMEQYNLNATLFIAPREIFSLLRRGADIDFQEEDYGNTIFMERCSDGKIDEVKRLLPKVDVNAVNSNNENALFRSLYSTIVKDEFIKFLLENTNINVNQLNFNNMTPLDIVTRERRLKTVELLRKHGAKTAAELKAEGKLRNKKTEKEK